MDKKKLLVADDDEDLLDLMFLYLSKQGYHVLTAEDGGKALEIALSEPVELLLLDLMMPVKDGFQVASELSAKLGTKAPKILVVTGRSLLEQDVALLLAGVAGAMQKPVKMDELAARVAELLAQGPEDSPFKAIE